MNYGPSLYMNSYEERPLPLRFVNLCEMLAADSVKRVNKPAKREVKPKPAKPKKPVKK